MLSVGPDRASPGLARRHTRACVCVFVCVFVCAGRVWGACVYVEGGYDRWGFEVGVGVGEGGGGGAGNGGAGRQGREGGKEGDTTSP
jgi:hypothetical protein